MEETDIMAKKKWYRFQVLMQYLMGSPHGLDHVHTLGVVTVEKEGAESVPDMGRRAVMKMVRGQPVLGAIVKAKGAKVWAKAIS